MPVTADTGISFVSRTMVMTLPQFWTLGECMNDHEYFLGAVNCLDYNCIFLFYMYRVQHT
jgi:hypothetical protein